MQQRAIEAATIHKQDQVTPSGLIFVIGLALNKQSPQLIMRVLVAVVAFGAICAFPFTNGSVVQELKSKTFTPQELKEISQVLHIRIGKPLDLNHIDEEIRRMFVGGVLEMFVFIWRGKTTRPTLALLRG